jgi:hypothetical protein
MARSVHLERLSITLPCPGGLDGAQRPPGALSSSVGPSQVNRASGQRGYSFAEVATPPTVERSATREPRVGTSAPTVAT